MHHHHKFCQRFGYRNEIERKVRNDIAEENKVLKEATKMFDLTKSQFAEVKKQKDGSMTSYRSESFSFEYLPP